MPDWEKLRDKATKYSHQGYDKATAAYQKSKSMPTNKSDPLRPPKQPPPTPTTSTSANPYKHDFLPPPTRPDSSRSTTSSSDAPPSLPNRSRVTSATPSSLNSNRQNTQTVRPTTTSFRGRSHPQIQPKLPPREDLPQYPGGAVNVLIENKPQFFSFMDEYFNKKNTKNHNEEPEIPLSTRPT